MSLRKALKYAKDASYAAAAQKYPNYVQELATAVLKTKDARGAYYFAKYIPDAPVDKLVKNILAERDARHAYLFARDIPGAPVAELAQIVIDGKDELEAWLFAKDVPGSPIGQLAQVVIHKKAVQHACWFARDIPSAPTARLAEVFKSILSVENQKLTVNFTETQWKTALDFSTDLTSLDEAIPVVAAL